jgi:hypothetical protein
VGSSTVHPKTFPPKASGDTSNPEFPSLCVFIVEPSNDWMLSNRKKDAAQEAVPDAVYNAKL